MSVLSSNNTAVQLFDTENEIIATRPNKTPCDTSSTESDLLKLFAADEKSTDNKKKKVQPSQSILQEMHQAAAFDAQTNVFTWYEQMSKQECKKAIAEQFYVTSNLTPEGAQAMPGVIKGTISQMINCDGACIQGIVQWGQHYWHFKTVASEEEPLRNR